MVEQAGTWHDQIEYAAQSDVGLRRSNNQDSYAVVLAADDAAWHDRGHLLMVADGMGAHAAGELASSMAVKSVPHTYHKLLDRAAPLALRQSIEEANAEIHNRGEANAEFHGMGTTCSAMVLSPAGAVVAHVGDSRAYRLRRNRLEQLSFDHSLVWEMMAAGQIASSDVPNFIPKNIITRSLGPHAEVQVDLEGPFPLEPGDVFFLCSDGLSGQVRDEELCVILDALPPAEAAQTLVDLANLRGGPDNITVIIARVKDVPAVTTADRAAAREASSPPRTPVHPLWWGFAAGFALAASFMGFIGRTIPAIVTGVAAVAVFLMGWFRRPDEDDLREQSGHLDGPLGTGPHTSLRRPPDASAVAGLTQIVEKLREAAVDEGWTVDWQGFNALTAAAHEELSKEDYAAAVRDTCRALSFMMAQLRQQRQPPAGGDASTMPGL